MRRQENFVRSLKINSEKELREYWEKHKRPLDIPFHLFRQYKNEGWLSFSDFIGTKIGWDGTYLDFNKSREFARESSLKTKKDWLAYCKSGNKPHNIHSDPSVSFKEKGWKGWRDFFGTEFLPFEEAREFARESSLKTKKDWLVYCKSGNKPHNIHSDPSLAFKDKGWKDWDDFLGNSNNEQIELDLN